MKQRTRNMTKTESAFCAKLESLDGVKTTFCLPFIVPELIPFDSKTIMLEASSMVSLCKIATAFSFMDCTMRVSSLFDESRILVTIRGSHKLIKRAMARLETK